MTKENPRAYVCIMAGGSGERFWPMSRQRTPKHLLKLFSDRTLIEETVHRLEGVVPKANIFVLTNQAQLEGTRAALPFLAPEQIIAEPAKRDTAPAAALATAIVMARDPQGVLALLPADALIKNTTLFAKQLAKGLARAEKSDALLTFAIKPTHASTGFGYLEMGKDDPEGFREVVRFVEKPNAETAEAYLKGAKHAWNAGMFVWRAQLFLREAEKNAPELAAFIKDYPIAQEGAYLLEKFPLLPKISVDYAIMEKAEKVETLLAEFDWDDVGTWTALPAHLPADALKNTIRGQVAAVESTGNIAISNGRVIALVGVKDLVVVETPDGVLVAHKDSVQDIKKLIPLLPKSVL